NISELINERTGEYQIGNLHTLYTDGVITSDDIKQAVAQGIEGTHTTIKVWLADGKIFLESRNNAIPNKELAGKIEKKFAIARDEIDDLLSQGDFDLFDGLDSSEDAELIQLLKLNGSQLSGGGMGLNVIYGLAENLGGKLNWTTEDEDGWTRFYIDGIPLKASSAGSALTYREAYQITGEIEVLRKRIPFLTQLTEKMRSGDLPDVINVGDLHGKNQVLATAIAKAKGYIGRDKSIEIIVHGDVFDRGDENAENFEGLQELKDIADENDNISVVFILGSHEYMLIQSIILGDKMMRQDWTRTLSEARKEKKAYNGGDIFMKQMGEDGALKVAYWVFENSKLLHIDEWEMLHVHAGLPRYSEGGPMMSRRSLEFGQRQLEDIQSDFANTGEMTDSLKQRLYDFLGEYFDLMWVLPGEWLDTLTATEEIDWFFADRGIAGVVFGHIHLDRPLLRGNRIICVDSNEGSPGYLMFSKEDGISEHLVDEGAADVIHADFGDLVTRVDQERERMQALLDKHHDRAKGYLEDLGPFTVRSISAMAKHIEKEKIRKGLEEEGSQDQEEWSAVTDAEDAAVEIMRHHATKTPAVSGEAIKIFVDAYDEYKKKDRTTILRGLTPAQKSEERAQDPFLQAVGFIQSCVTQNMFSHAEVGVRSYADTLGVFFGADEDAMSKLMILASLPFSAESTLDSDTKVFDVTVTIEDDSAKASSAGRRGEEIRNIINRFGSGDDGSRLSSAELRAILDNPELKPIVIDELANALNDGTRESVWTHIVMFSARELQANKISPEDIDPILDALEQALSGAWFIKDGNLVHVAGLLSSYIGRKGSQDKAVIMTKKYILPMAQEMLSDGRTQYLLIDTNSLKDAFYYLLDIEELEDQILKMLISKAHSKRARRIICDIAGTLKLSPPYYKWDKRIIDMCEQILRDRDQMRTWDSALYLMSSLSASRSLRSHYRRLSDLIGDGFASLSDIIRNTTSEAELSMATVIFFRVLHIYQDQYYDTQSDMLSSETRDVIKGLLPEVLRRARVDLADHTTILWQDDTSHKIALPNSFYTACYLAANSVAHIHDDNAERAQESMSLLLDGITRGDANIRIACLIGFATVLEQAADEISRDSRGLIGALGTIGKHMRVTQSYHRKGFDYHETAKFPELFLISGFITAVADMGDQQTLSLALNVVRLLERRGKELSEDNAQQAIDIILRARDIHGDRQLLGDDVTALLVTNDEKYQTGLYRFDENMMAVFADACGTKNIVKGLTGPEKKDEILGLISSPQEGLTTFWFNGHGLPESLVLGDGHISVEELGEALIELQENGGDISSVNIMIDVCFGYDFALNLNNYLGKRRASSRPVIVTASNRGQAGFGDPEHFGFSMFLDALNKAMVSRAAGLPLSVDDIYLAESYVDDEDFAVFVPFSVKDAGRVTEVIVDGTVSDSIDSVEILGAEPQATQKITTSLHGDILEIYFGGATEFSDLDYSQAGVLADNLAGSFDAIRSEIHVVDNKVVRLPAKVGVFDLRQAVFSGDLAKEDSTMIINPQSLEVIIANLSDSEAEELIAIILMHESTGDSLTEHAAAMMAEAYAKTKISDNAWLAFKDFIAAREAGRSAFGPLDIVGTTAAKEIARASGTEIAKVSSAGEEEAEDKPAKAERVYTVTADAVSGIRGVTKVAQDILNVRFGCYDDKDPRQFGLIIPDTSFLRKADQELLSQLAERNKQSKRQKFIITVDTSEDRDKLVKDYGFRESDIRTLDSYYSYLRADTEVSSPHDLDIEEKILAASFGMRAEIGTQPIGIITDAHLGRGLEKIISREQERAPDKMRGVFVVCQELPDSDISLDGEIIQRESAILFRVLFAQMLTRFSEYMSNPTTTHPIITTLPPIDQAEFHNKLRTLLISKQAIESAA
ncbi:metallophosphoesterase, partial [Candidatus Omnitrophota bacterium]